MAGTITSLGLGSGLDIDSLIEGLLQAQSRPIQLLQSRQADIDIRISGLGQVRSAIDGFRESVRTLTSESNFRSTEASSLDEEVVTASTDNGALSGSYDIEVLQVASRHKVGTQIFADKTASVGQGTIDITGGGAAFSIQVNAQNNTLEQIRDAINGNVNNTGITASIINVDGGSSLVLSANETGLNNAITVNVTDDDGISIDNAGLSSLTFNNSELQAAQDASITVDGLAVTQSSNQISGVVDGVTFNVIDLGSTQIKISESNTIAADTIAAMVDSYNALSATLQVQRSGFLSGDSTLLTIENRIRNTFSTAYGNQENEVKYSFQVGFSFDEDGILSFDQSEFEDAIGENFDEVVRFFTDSENGFAESLDSLLNSYLRSNGLIDARTDGLNATREDLDDDILNLQRRLEQAEERLVRQFSALDGLVAQLNSTSSFLNTQLNNLPVFTNNRRN